MSTQLRVGPNLASFRDVGRATMNKNGSFDALIHLMNGYTNEVLVVNMLNDAFVGTKNNRDVLIPFHAVAMLEIL